MRPHQLSANSVFDALLDIRTVFDPDSVVMETLREALGHEALPRAVAWIALPSSSDGVVIEHILGQWTSQLVNLDVSTGQGVTGRVLKRQSIHWVDDYAAAPTITHEFDPIMEAEGIRRMIAAPLSVDHTTLGVLAIGRRDRGTFADETIENVTRLAKRASLALAVAKQSRDNASAAALAERRRLSEELHDGLSAVLFSLASRTDRLHRRTTEPAIVRELEAFQHEVFQASELVRSLVTGWYAAATADLHAEVQGVVEDFERRTGIRSVAIFMGSTPSLDSSRVQALARFVAVTLANVERHSTATRASVTVASLPTQVTVAVFNDGVAPGELVHGIGLSGVEDRIIKLGGSVSTITDGENDGFTIRARLQL